MKLRALLSLDQAISSFTCQWLMHLVISIHLWKIYITPHSGFFSQKSLGNVEDRVSKAVFSHERRNPPSFHLIFIVKNLNFRLH